MSSESALLQIILYILGQEKGSAIEIGKEFLNMETAEALDLLVDEKLIFDKKDIENGGIILRIVNWDKLWNFFIEKYDHVTDPYGKEKQMTIIREAIVKKALKQENKEISISLSELGEEDKEHINFAHTIQDLADDSFLIIKDIKLPLSGESEFKIEITGDLSRFAEEEKSPDQKEKTGQQKFRFSNGVLFRDSVDNTLAVKNENTQEYRLLKLALSLPIGERIDAVSDGLEMSFRQIYDTAMRLNEKINKIFGVKDFFVIDSQNKHVIRSVE